MNSLDTRECRLQTLHAVVRVLLGGEHRQLAVRAVDSALRAGREVFALEDYCFDDQVAVLVRTLQRAARAGVDLVGVDLHHVAYEPALEGALDLPFLERPLHPRVHVLERADLALRELPLAVRAWCERHGVPLLLLFLGVARLRRVSADSEVLHEACLTEQVRAAVDVHWATRQAVADAAHPHTGQFLHEELLVEAGLECQCVGFTAWHASRQRRHTVGRGSRARLCRFRSL